MKTIHRRRAAAAAFSTSFCATLVFIDGAEPADGPSPARTMKEYKARLSSGMPSAADRLDRWPALAREAEASAIALRRQCFERLVQLLELAVLHPCPVMRLRGDGVRRLRARTLAAFR